MKRLIITIVCLFLYNFLYAQNPGNIVRDVPGQPIARWLCANDGDILKYDISVSKFVCAPDDTGGAACTDDDETAIGDGADAVCTALPDCPDTGGNHWNYDASTNTVSCGTSGSGGSGNALLDGSVHTDTTNSASNSLVI